MSDKQIEKSTLYDFYINELFPFALVCGMTYDLFWNEDGSILLSYVKAKELNKEYEINTINFTGWINGLYTYKAIASSSPYIKHRSKYPKKPIELNNKENDEDENYEHKLMKQFANFNSFMIQNNKKYKGG